MLAEVSSVETALPAATLVDCGASPVVISITDVEPETDAPSVARRGVSDVRLHLRPLGGSSRTGALPFSFPKAPFIASSESTRYTAETILGEVCPRSL